MENVLLNEQQTSGPDQLLKVTALLYLQEALVKQEYESCRELIDTAKGFGAAQGDISDVIADYLKGTGPGRQRSGRLRS